jgi:hypothetical protein
LLAFEARIEERFEGADRRFDRLDQRFDKVEGRLDHLDTGLRGLRTDMPKIVGDVMREVFRERDGKA